jgi:hypothetical protein
MEREQLIGVVIKRFVHALLESLKPFKTSQNRVEFLETLIAYLNGVYNHEEPILAFNFEGNPFDAELFIRKNILLKYREKAKPFVDTGLRYYFEKDIHLQTYLFERLELKDPIFSGLEYEQYINYIHTILHNLIERICVQPVESGTAENDTDLKALTLSELGNEQPETHFKSKSKEYTRSRQILLFYFVLKLLGKSRSTAKLIELAEFGHVLFAWPTDNASNGAIYRMLKDAPYLKQDKSLLTDLEFIKKQFERIEHTEGAILVQKEINSIKHK